MICPADGTQMVQLVKDGIPIGYGISTDIEYTTAEIKKCPECGRKVSEFYSATILNLDAIKTFMEEMARVEAIL